MPINPASTFSYRKVPMFSDQEINASDLLSDVFKRVSGSRRYILGEEVAQFEIEFSRYVGTKHCTSVANGTDALELALRAVGVARGDAVICAANAGFYSSTAILAVGAIPNYVDIDESTLTLSTHELRRRLTAMQPAAVIVTHLYGQLADMDELVFICRSKGIPLIEDCAQAHGARLGDKLAGSFADVSCFSFYPTKNLGALGDGGAILTDRDDIANSAKALRQYGWSSKYVVSHSGGRNSRLDELQAAILRDKLPRLDMMNSQRQSIARRYSELLSGLPIRCPSSIGGDFVAHLYVVRTANRERLRAHLLDCGVMTDVHYPIPDHRQSVHHKLYADTHLPITEAVCSEILSLPCYPGMHEDDVTHVGESVKAFFKHSENSNC